MQHNQFSYAAFGKRPGFEIFRKGGFIFEDEQLGILFESFLALDLKRISLSREQNLYASWRFMHEGHHYVFFVQFRYAPDSAGRPGFYGGAVAFRDCFSRHLKNLIDFLEQLTVFAESHLKGEEKAAPKTPDLNIKEYGFSFAPIEIDSAPVFMDIQPRLIHFFQLTLSDHLGPGASPVFFSLDVSLQEQVRQREFLVYNYEGCFLKSKEEHKERQEELKHNIRVLSSEKQAIHTHKQELEAMRLDLLQETEALRNNHGVLQKQYKALEAKCEELKAQVEHTTRTYDKAINRLEIAEEESKRLEGTNKQLSDKNNSLQKQLFHQQQKLGKLTLTIKERKDEEQELLGSVKVLRSENKSLKRLNRQLSD